jgi:hypothetical protein
MKHIILFLSLFFAGNFTQAQAPLWAESVDGLNPKLSPHTLDDSGNVYIAGSFERTADFDPGPGVTILNPVKSGDMFILKLNAAGDFVWVKQISSNVYPSDIAVDPKGNVYITGEFTETVDFDPGPGIYNLVALSSSPIRAEAFILKLDTAGNFSWAKSIGALENDRAYSIALDRSQNVYVTGSFSTTVDFNPDPSAAFMITSSGFISAFILKLRNDGHFLWAKSIGGANTNAEGFSIFIDPNGDVYTAGNFNGTVDLNSNPSATLSVSSAGSYDVFISKLDSTGNFIWGKRMGGAGEDRSVSITVDKARNVITTGFFNESADFNPGAATNNLTSAGFDDIFISKLDSAGNFVWAKGIGANYYDNPSDVTTDPSGNIYTTGTFSKTVDFDPGAGSFAMTSGEMNTFILKLDPLGNFTWAKNIGASWITRGFSIGLDSMQNIYLTGAFTEDTDFDPGTGVYTIPKTGSGSSSLYILKLNSSGNLSTALSDIEPDEFIFQIYPNPASDILTIEVNEHIRKTSYVITDITGMAVLGGDLTGKTTALDISSLAKGLYFVTVGQANYKLVK